MFGMPLTRDGGKRLDLGLACLLPTRYVRLGTSCLASVSLCAWVAVVINHPIPKEAPSPSPSIECLPFTHVCQHLARRLVAARKILLERAAVPDHCRKQRVAILTPPTSPRPATGVSLPDFASRMVGTSVSAIISSPMSVIRTLIQVSPPTRHSFRPNTPRQCTPRQCAKLLRSPISLARSSGTSRSRQSHTSTSSDRTGSCDRA